MGEFELFDDLARRPRRRPWAALVSLVAHGVAAGAVLLVPLLLPEPLPTPSDPVRLILYDPPPPPPPPPLRYGSSRPAKKRVEPPKAAPSPPTVPHLVQPIEPVEPVETPSVPVASDQQGSPSGTESGSPTGSEYGMEGGGPGGVPGGEPGGVVGGVIGGRGTGPVPERFYDRGPLPLRLTRPVYPQDAFVKNIEGTVLVEILIDANGRVVEARVVRSMPLLDTAAVEAVRHWVFAPALKKGQPVAALALAPITFQIY